MGFSDLAVMSVLPVAFEGKVIEVFFSEVFFLRGISAQRKVSVRLSRVLILTIV